MPVKWWGQQSLSIYNDRLAFGCCRAGHGVLCSTRRHWGHAIRSRQCYSHEIKSPPQHSLCQAAGTSPCSASEHLPAVGGWLNQRIQLHHPGVFFPGSWTAPSITGKSPPSVSNSWHITIHVCKKVQHGNEPSMKLCPAMDLLIPARGRTAGGKSRMSQVRSIRTPNLSDSPLTKYLNKEVKPQPIQEELLSHVCHQSRM